MRITHISIYPVKSVAAIALDNAAVLPRGLEGDRRWVVASIDGQCLHQRVHPKLALVQAELLPEGQVSINAVDMPKLCVTQPYGNPRQSVEIWGDTVSAADAGNAAAEWFTQFLGLPCRLLYMDDAAFREIPPPYGNHGEVVSFADALPVLLATEASLADLNRRMDIPVPMSRFRPNVEVDGDIPWAEEQWKRIRIGSVDFEVTHACVRCVMTTIDQQTGEKPVPGEPLKTLARFRSNPDGVCFGINLKPTSLGEIACGDQVNIMSTCETEESR